jgi:hypothetical protein
MLEHPPSSIAEETNTNRPITTLVCVTILFMAFLL